MWATIFLLITATSLVLYQVNDLVYTLSCSVLNRCLSFNPNDPLFNMKGYSFIWLFLGTIFLWSLFVCLIQLRNEVDPEKYRKFLEEKIAGYRDQSSGSSHEQATGCQQVVHVGSP